MNDLTDNVDFSLIRYANCWEDAEILLEGLNPIEGSKILSVGSAGDNSFSLLVTNPEIIVSIDINKTQLYLIELKKIAYKYLDYVDLLGFIGFTDCKKRLSLYTSLRNKFTTACRNFWDTNLKLIDKGIVFSGKFEKYLLKFNKYILPLIHSNSTISELIRHKNNNEQTVFYYKKWMNQKWKWLFKIFFSRFVLGRFGRDPQFMNEVNVNVGEFIFNKTENHLKSELSTRNEYLNFILTGKFSDALPHYVRKENYELIKKNIDNLVIKEGYVNDAFNDKISFGYLNLSNIFEYMNNSEFLKVSEIMLNNTNKDARFLYWNLMVSRRISKLLPNRLVYNKDLSEKLSNRDKGFFYNRMIVDDKKNN